MKTDTQKSQDDLIVGAYKHNTERMRAMKTAQQAEPTQWATLRSAARPRNPNPLSSARTGYETPKAGLC